MKTITKYIPVGPDSITKYFQYGCVFPHHYAEDLQKDSQAINKYHLTLFNQPWQTKDEYCFEVILLEKEFALIDKIGQLEFYHGFLPISRIRHIHINADIKGIKEKTKNLIWNINQGTAFIPNHLLSFNSNIVTNQMVPSEQAPEVSYQEADSLRVKIESFDRNLGALAFLKTAIQNLNDPKLNYPKNYINVLRHYNRVVFPQSDNSNIQLSPRLYGFLQRNSPLLSYINKNIDKDVFKEVAEKEGKILVSRLGSLELDSNEIDSDTFFISLLYTFGKEKNKVKSLEDFFSSKFPDLPWQLREEISFFMGANYKYSSFYKNYQVGGRNINVKFPLLRAFDYYIIESTYSYIVNDKDNSIQINYLDEVIKNLEESELSFIPGYVVGNYFGETVVTQKRSYDDNFSQLLDKLSKSIANWFNFPFNISIQKIRLWLDKSLRSWFEDVVNEIQSDMKKDYERLIQNQQTQLPKQAKSKITLNEAESSYASKGHEDNSHMGLSSENHSKEYVDPPKIVRTYTQSELKKLKKKDLEAILESLGIKLPMKNNKDRIEAILGHQRKEFDSSPDSIEAPVGNEGAKKGQGELF